MPNISVIICSHNPRPDYLRRTLDALHIQTLPIGVWELILVDNASNKALHQDWDLSWHKNARHIREDRLGLTYARTCAIEQTTTDLLVFVDDDNVLAADYLEKAYLIGSEWRKLGAWGGQNIPEFESTPDDTTRAFWTREFEHDRWTNLGNDSGATPCGAGLCVRRSIAEGYVDHLKDDPARYALDRRGTQLFSSGDIDLALTACDLGLGIGMFTSLKLTHLIPNRRLEEGYLLELVEKTAYSDLLLKYFRGHRPSRQSRSQRMLRWYESLWMAEHDRRFDSAKRRGTEAAIKHIEGLEPERSFSTPVEHAR